MSTTSRVQRARKADAARRRVRTVNPGVLGPRKAVPRRKPTARKPTGRPPAYRKTAAGAGFSAVLGALFFATGSIFWAVGAVTTAAGTAAVVHIEYRRQLAEVKATGRPIGAKPKPAPEAASTEGLEPVPEPKPVDLDAPPAPRPQPAPQRQGGRAKPGGDHAARCTAKSPSTCRCPDGPNRAGAKRTSTTKTRSRRSAGKR